MGQSVKVRQNASGSEPARSLLDFSVLLSCVKLEKRWGVLTPAFFTFRGTNTVFADA
jgi:hypothetical protein